MLETVLDEFTKRIALALKRATPLARDGEQAMKQWRWDVYAVSDVIARATPVEQRAAMRKLFIDTAEGATAAEAA